MADDTEPKRCPDQRDNTKSRYSDITTDLRRYWILNALDGKFLSTVTIGYVFNNSCTALLVTSSGDVYGVYSSADDLWTVEHAPDDLWTDEHAPDELWTVEHAPDDSATDKLSADEREGQRKEKVREREGPVMRRIEQLSHKNVVDFTSSDEQVVALTNEGRVYWCGIESCVEDKSSGANNSNRDGEGTKTYWRLMPLPKDKMIIHITFGHYVGMLLTREGELLQWSKSNFNESFWFQDGFKNSGTKQNVTTKIVSIEHGNKQLLALSSYGELYEQRLNNDGQLGTKQEINSRIRNSNLASTQYAAPTQNIYEHNIDPRIHRTRHFSSQQNAGPYARYGPTGPNRTYGATGAYITYEHSSDADKSTQTSSLARADISVGSGRVQPKGDPNAQFVNIAAYENVSAAQTVTGKVYVWGECLNWNLLTPTETYITRLNNVFPILAKMVITPKAIKSENKDRHYMNSSAAALHDSIAVMFDAAEDSDVTFKVGGKTIHTHKLLLKNRCEYFRLMFSSDWKESTTGVIEITNFTYEVYRAFLYYLYTDELDITYEDAVEMLDLAQSYCATDLKLRCERVIEWWIRDNNAADIYQLAVKYDCSTLQEACVRYGVDNMKAIFSSAAFKEIELQIGRDFVIRIAEKAPNKTA